MAEKRTINIDINNNADEAAKDFENFAKATNAANDSVEGLNKTFEEVYGEIQPLTTRMGEAEDRLYELAAAGDTTSKEYQQLLNKVGQYRKVQIQTDLAVDQAANTMSQKLGGALNGAASAFSAVQGVMALTGSESEALEESLLKVQGAMAFQQGVQGVLDYSKSVGLASKATALWNAILNLNPLALIATAIVGIVVYLVTFTDALDAAIQTFKDLGDSLGITNFKEQDLAEERNKRNTEEIARIKELERVRDLAFKERERQFDREIALLEAEGKSSFKLRQQKLQDLLAIQKQKASDLRSDVSNANARVFMAKGGIEQKLAEASLKKYKEFLVEINSEIADTENQLKINIINNNKEKTDSYSNYLADRKVSAEEEKRINQEIIDSMIEDEAKLEQTFEDIKRENEDRFRTEQENEVLLVEEKYDALEAMAFGNAEALEQIEIARLNELNEIKQKFADEEVKIEKKKTEEIKEVEEATQEQKIAAVKDTLSTIANLAELFAGESEREQKKAFKIQKAANIAQATIDTYASAVSSYNSLSGIPVVGPVLGGAAAAAAVTAGLLNIKSISQQEFGGGVGDQPAVPSDVGGGGAPQFNVVGDSGVNQLAQLQQQPTQAFVVSGEVTTAQALDRNRVQNATL